MEIGDWPFASQRELGSVVSYRLDELTLPQLTLPALGSALHRHRMVVLRDINEHVPFLLYTTFMEGMGLYGAVTGLLPSLFL